MKRGAKEVGLFEAKTRLSALVARVQRGEEITMRAGCAANTGGAIGPAQFQASRGENSRAAPGYRTERRKSPQPY